MYTLGQYLFSLDDPHGLLRTLDGLEPERGADGRPVHAVGNSAAVFRVRCGGRRMALRCFLRPMRHLREIYGERLHERELFLYTAPDKGFWTDVVLTAWIEGPTLREAIDRAVADGDAARLGELARRFDALAAELIADDTAHGDLKPENLVVGADGQLHPIDLDAMFLPAFAGERSPELGTAAYQHPARTEETFDERIDDYPAALISTALHALAADPGLGARYAGCCSTPPEFPARRPIAKSSPSSNSAAWQCSTASPACWRPPSHSFPASESCSGRQSGWQNGPRAHPTPPDRSPNSSSGRAAGASALRVRSSLRRSTTTDSTSRKGWQPSVSDRRGTTSTRRAAPAFRVPAARP